MSTHWHELSEYARGCLTGALRGEESRARAAAAVIFGGRSIRGAACEYGVPPSTLFAWVRRGRTALARAGRGRRLLRRARVRA